MRAPLITAAICLYLLPFIVWWLFFGNHLGFGLSHESQDWGAFGSFFGGLMAPLYGLLSVVFLYFSIHKSDQHNQQALNVMMRQLHASSVQHDQSLRMLRIQTNRDFFMRLFETFERQLDSTPTQKDIDIKAVPVFEGGEEQAIVRAHPVKEELVSFGLNLLQQRSLSEKYLELVQAISSNAAQSLETIFIQANRIEDDDELEEIVQLMKACIDANSAECIYRLYLQLTVRFGRYAFLDALEELNQRAEFMPDTVEKYQLAYTEYEKKNPQEP